MMTSKISVSSTPYPRQVLRITLVSIIIVLFLCCIPSFAAGYIYLDTGSQPSLVAHSEGDTRYYPGDPFEMTIILENTARDTSMELAPLLAYGAYDPSTALGVTVTPYLDDAPVTLKTLPLPAGDIGSWDEVPVKVRGVVHPDARPGVYSILLGINYSYVYAIPMTGADFTTFTPLYHEKSQAIPVRFRVPGEVQPDVIITRAENMVPGTQGYITAEVKNTGFLSGDEVNFRIVPEDANTFQVVDQSIYVGKFAPGDIVPVRARIATRENTGAGSYPATLEGQYRDSSGVTRNTTPVHIGIMVSRGATMETLTGNITLSPGETKTINVTYRNTGDSPARNAQARIVGNQIIDAVADTASLGYFAPGDSKTVQYVVSAKRSAIPGKSYVVNTEIKYRDELGALMLSDEMSLGADIVSPAGVDALLLNPVILVIIAGIIAILGYIYWKLLHRKKKI